MLVYVLGVGSTYGGERKKAWRVRWWVRGRVRGREGERECERGGGGVCWREGDKKRGG